MPENCCYSNFTHVASAVADVRGIYGSLRMTSRNYSLGKMIHPLQYIVRSDVLEAMWKTVLHDNGLALLPGKIANNSSMIELAPS